MHTPPVYFPLVFSFLSPVPFPDPRFLYPAPPSTVNFSGMNIAVGLSDATHWAFDGPHSSIPGFLRCSTEISPRFRFPSPKASPQRQAGHSTCLFSPLLPPHSPSLISSLLSFPVLSLLLFFSIFSSRLLPSCLSPHQTITVTRLNAAGRSRVRRRLLVACLARGDAMVETR